MSATLETSAQTQGQQGGVSAETQAAVAAQPNATALAMHRAINVFCVQRPMNGVPTIGVFALADELARDFRGVSVESALRIIDLDIELRQAGRMGPERYETALVEAWSTDTEARAALGERLVYLASKIVARREAEEARRGQPLI